MGATVDFLKCESLDRRRQRLTEAERRGLEELLREARPSCAGQEPPAEGSG